MIQGIRKHYRVAGDSVEGVEVVLRVNGRDWDVHLIDISAAGIAIAVPGWTEADANKVLKSTMESPTIVIRSPRVDRELVLRCKVAHLYEHSAGTVMGMSFQRRMGQEQRMDRDLLRIFNRRGAVRAETDPRQPLLVVICAPNGRELARGLVRDLSMTGISATIGPSALARIEAHDRARIRFKVKGVTLCIDAERRYARASEVMDPKTEEPIPIGIVGFEFDERQRERAQNCQPIASWVMTRQIEQRRSSMRSGGQQARF